MRPVVLDFETYFGDDFTLSKMTTESYIRDPRFEAHGAAVKWSPGTPAVWYSGAGGKGSELYWQLQQEDWSDVFLICHHSQFDGLILNHHYGVRPAMWGCTLSMARLLLGNHLSVSLEAVRKHFGIPSKTTPYSLFKGKRWHELSPAVQAQIGEGACDEVESIWTVFCSFLQQGFPHGELEVIDSVIRMFTEPAIVGDQNLLARIWEEEATKKQNRLDALGVTATDLQSADKFADLLREQGIEPGTKTSPKGKEIYAFAKTDQFMRDLLEDDSETVQALAEARLGQKSTFAQTRAETLGWMASRGPVPIYLSYCGAGTLRPAGGDKCNFLNMRRNSPIRRSLCAPEGYLLGPADSSQIECRVLHYLAGGPDEPVIQKFRNNEDPYVDLATEFYREPIYKPKKDDPRREEMEAKRGMGKQGRLMCLGPDTLVLTNNGVRPITTVRLTDRLWDGEEWVAHQGLIYQGAQRVVDIEGVKMTSDHRVLCGPRSWLPAFCLLNADILSPALGVGLGSLPLPVSNLVRKAGYSTWLSDVRAALPSIPLIQRICFLAGQHVAMGVRKKLRDIGQKNIMVTRMFVLMSNIGDVCLGEFQRSTIVASRSPNITDIPTTTVEESPSTNRGSEIVALSSLIWSRFQAGIIQIFRLIGSKMTRVISREIFASRRPNSKPKIEGNSAFSNKSCPTYDLAYAGPRNRFTVVSDAGPLIVHNCGYGAAGKQFKVTAKNGLYGPSVDIPIEDADRFVAMYRSSNVSICGPNGLWNQANWMLGKLADGSTVEWGPLQIRDHRIWIEGAPMLYTTLEWHVPGPDEEHVKDFERRGFWRLKTRDGWKKMWGSKLVQNCCEGVARMIISQAMTRIKRKFGVRTLNWPYDELLLLIPKSTESEALFEACLAEMKITPSWLPGLPLDAEGSLSERYSK